MTLFACQFLMLATPTPIRPLLKLDPHHFQTHYYSLSPTFRFSDPLLFLCCENVTRMPSPTRRSRSKFRSRFRSKSPRRSNSPRKKSAKRLDVLDHQRKQPSGQDPVQHPGRAVKDVVLSPRGGVDPGKGEEESRS
jgi:hypothetical protein